MIDNILIVDQNRLVDTPQVGDSLSIPGLSDIKISMPLLNILDVVVLVNYEANFFRFLKNRYADGKTMIVNKDYGTEHLKPMLERVQRIQDHSKRM